MSLFTIVCQDFTKYFKNSFKQKILENFALKKRQEL